MYMQPRVNNVNCTAVLQPYSSSDQSWRWLGEHYTRLWCVRSEYRVYFGLRSNHGQGPGADGRSGK